MVVGTRVLVPVYNGYPMAFDADTGNLLWAATIDQGHYQTPTVLDDMVYVREIFSGKIYALAIQDGTDSGHLFTGSRIVISDRSYTWRQW